MSALEFDPVEHVYTVGGKRVPSVTQILAPLIDYSSVPVRHLERARERGVLVHDACELYDLNSLDEERFREQCADIAPYLTAWQKFRGDHKVIVLDTETQLHHAVYGFAGTRDVLVSMVGAGGARIVVLVDRKTTAAIGPAVGVQLAAYQKLHEAAGGLLVDGRLAVQLKPDGTYQLHWFDSPGDWSTFLALLTVHNFTKKHGLTAAF